jgi:hypothetical protein
MSTDYRGTRTADPPPVGLGNGSPVGTRAIEVDTIAAPIGVSVEERDPIRWGPILAGVVTALAVMLFLTALGLALGFSAFTGDETAQDWGTAAGIWGGFSLLASFFFGGWMAGRGSAAGLDRNGLLNGFVAGAATLLLIFWLAATTLAGALGFIGSTVAGLTGTVASSTIEAVAPEAIDVVEGQAPPVAPEDVETAVEDPGAVVEEAVPAEVEQQAEAVATQAEQAAEAVTEAAAPGAWGTFIAILLALAAATIGGMLGQAERRFVIPGSRVTTS